MLQVGERVQRLVPEDRDGRTGVPAMEKTRARRGGGGKILAGGEGGVHRRMTPYFSTSFRIMV